MNKQDIQTVLNALQNSQLFVQASSNINVLEGFGQQLDDADEAIALLRAFLVEPSEKPVAWRHKVLGRIETAEAFAMPYNWGDRSEWEPLFTRPASKPSEPVSDLVERLQLGDGSSPDHALLLEAANAIEHLIGELRKGLKQEEILENKLFKEIHKSTPDPVAYLVLFEGAGKLLEFTKGNYLHGAKVEHIPLFTHPASKPEPLTDDEITSIVRDASKGSAIKRDGSTSHRIARAVEAAVWAKFAAVKQDAAIKEKFE